MIFLSGPHPSIHLVKIQRSKLESILWKWSDGSNYTSNSSILSFSLFFSFLKFFIKHFHQSWVVFFGHLHFLFKAMLNIIWKCHYLEPCFFWQEDIPIFQALCKTKRVKLEEECKKWYRGELNNEICHFFFLNSESK